MRDWQCLIAVLIMFGFYLTPIFYDFGDTPAVIAPRFAPSPMTGIVATLRSIFLPAEASDQAALATIGGASTALLAVGLFLFSTPEDVLIGECLENR